MSKDGYAGKISQKLPKQSMHNVYSVILEYEEKQEAESIGSHTIIDGGWVRNTNMLYFLGFLE